MRFCVEFYPIEEFDVTIQLVNNESEEDLRVMSSILQEKIHDTKQEEIRKLEQMVNEKKLELANDPRSKVFGHAEQSNHLV